MKKLLKRVANACLPPCARSVHAKQLWDSPVFKQAVKDVVADIQGEWLHCENPQQREELHRQSRALHRVTEKLNSYYQPTEE
ncbi:hypothetical protein MO867_12680 [Microbulbifer sp. OS29]|uniref:Uncharacterized protein n=1 Tax=Microbulbifer okhotskensis TaxID=2926617 RepID=A0A9X2J5H0_9GAMM|nr:hypothetical protein [Microbulbifer okhotskensis]MCO1335188.1 hypothetical protein [Microbulbifer okhotskensis]